jgi:pimeloyl-ACP methyl ester carboxylesterase
VTSAVLVHGLYHVPEHFAAVADLLRARGVEVAVPELHRGSLDADTEAVQAAVDAMRVPPVVLGHSYGGSVITGLTGAAHLVYLAAFVPDAGESAASSRGATDLLRAAVRPDGGGATHVDPALAADLFYRDCSPEVAARAIGLLRRQLPGCGRGVPRRQAWRDTPSTYVVCARDEALDPAVQRGMARRCTATLTWQTGHSPFLSRPDLVAGLLE